MGLVKGEVALVRMIFYIIVFAVIGGLAWIRLAPSDPAVWHVDPMVSANQDLVGGVRRRLDDEAASFDRLHAIILATPRTELLAGGPADEHATYITRSRWIGFPDYTTIRVADDDLELFARLRFGRSDLGVNRMRVETWLTELAETQSGS